MKFAIAVVVLAVVLGIESSVVPIIPGISYTTVGAPVVVASGPSIATIRGPAAVPVAYHVPAPVAIHVPVPAVVAPVVAAQGTYVAQTRGATHIAPLEGHANSAASVNLEPAPGTV